MADKTTVLTRQIGKHQARLKHTVPQGGFL
jgi:hypothetical protein